MVLILLLCCLYDEDDEDEDPGLDSEAPSQPAFIVVMIMKLVSA